MPKQYAKNWHKPLSAACGGFIVLIGVTQAEQCPIAASLIQRPESLIEQLKVLPAVKSELKRDSAPLLEPTCPYRRATYFQMGPRPSGICTVGDQRASFAAISLVAGDKAFASIYIFDLSTTNLTSLRAGLELIARPVDRMDPIRYPETLR
ncbi:hypothetical protein [Xanthomonas oryzae]|uniref:hypothetical protein n=1 Tax=Xanthomonas oryzae TaxID=347 RepID=UPI0004642656|nr:hypothetical protein [Xanthomonas oryzae]MEC5080035.1 hypothetical protein [Xanthomonas oryzae pv. oryzicola]MEC5114686.1 hypothetical protein [Xanthomonas oryzae pv. oryzicola]OWB27589.1 hypothetical protein XocBAI20_13775 [Xanthomonas oryzae pv. oryzicola]QGH64573.1 hypothetical protein GHV42_00870 [Xanthomonas oryzae pv. oryzicola]UBB93292.1 hypothetical protein K2I41_01175 [Xanthomonas oryzae pv. oryzicola]